MRVDTARETTPRWRRSSSASAGELHPRPNSCIDFNHLNPLVVVLGSVEDGEDGAAAAWLRAFAWGRGTGKRRGYRQASAGARRAVHTFSGPA